MKLTIANDIHLGSTHSTHTWSEFYEIVQHTKGLICNGDIVDFANCKPEEFLMWKMRARWIKETCENNGGAYIIGNHELDELAGFDSVMLNDIYIDHGDIGFFWTKEKAEKYRSKKPGSGFIRRLASKYYDLFRYLKPFKFTDRFRARCDEVIAEFNPRAIVLAHFHPPSNIDFVYRGVRILILKRGVQEIEI